MQLLPTFPIDPSALMTQLGSPNPIQFAWTPLCKTVNSAKLCPLHGDLLAHVHETDHVRSVHHVVVQLLAFHRPEVAVTEIPNPVTHLTLPARCYGEFSGAQGREGLRRLVDLAVPGLGRHHMWAFRSSG